MKLKKTRNSLIGLTALFGTVFAITTVGYQIADANRATLDSTLGTSSNKTLASPNENRYKSKYSSLDDVRKAAKEIAVEQGEEGTVVMKNDNDVLPISTNKVALFGGASYMPYQGNSDLKAGNSDAVDLVGALTNAGIEVNSTMKAIYDEIISDQTETKGQWGGTTITYNKLYKTAAGDMTPYQINEVNPSDYGKQGYGSNANWKDGIDKASTIGIVTLARGVGEGSTFLPGISRNSKGELVERDPLALSDDELDLIDAAKESCSKVIVLLNTGNTMEIGDIATGGSHEVDGICYIGIPNDYQFTGIVNVLTGKTNATGALPDTYVKDNTSLPAMQNFGGNLTAISDTTYPDANDRAKLQKVYDKYDGGLFADANITRSSETIDTRYPKTEINESAADATSFGGGTNNYNTNHFIVEAEGIYVGYKYYETRYTDAVNSTGNANSVKGSTTGSNWDYDNEVIYPFGYGLSYLDYTQSIKSVSVDKSENGNVTAVIAVTNNSDKDGKFLASLYTQAPYTSYDKQYLVEKSAVNFLTSGKVEVKAGKTEEVTLTVPTKYLASYDYTKAKTYILDEGDYLFTAANGSHEAANNFLATSGSTVSGTTGKVEKWNLATFDSTTFATSNGTAVTNVADDCDMNYWLPGTVTYLSRNNWDATYPKNYLKENFKIGDSSKKTEWINILRGNLYNITETTEVVENIDGKDDGYKFNYEQLTEEVISDINNEYWDKLVNEISVNKAVGAVIHGGSQTDSLDFIENPVVNQHEGVNGTTGSITGEDNSHFNISSQTMLAATFNPELALKWGHFLGDYSVHWLTNEKTNSYTAWGTGLTLRRTPYNGRNYEYISEDPMLTNRMGYGVLKGSVEEGFLCGPKHMGFNDQEHNRSGVGVYINEQKLRETDLRGFEGGLNEGGGLAVMIAFNRLGPTNAAHSTALIKKILRGEWGFKGLISTDMMSNKYYFDGASMVAAGITQVADFAGNNSYISKNGDYSEGDSNWAYITIEKASKDANFVKMARENLKYQLYAFAHTPLYNTAKTISVTPWWDATIKAISITSGILMGAAAAGYIILNFAFRKEN